MSDSTALRVFYSPKDDATRRWPFPKRAKVAGSRLEAPSPLFVSANRILWSYCVDLWTWRCLLNYQSGEGIEKNYLGHFNDGADGRQLLFWLELPFTGYFIRILFPRNDHVFHERYTDYFTVNFTETLTHARAIGTRPLFLPCGLGTRLIKLLNSLLPC